MAFTRPTLDQLRQRSAASLAQWLGLGTLLARGPLRVISWVIAALVHGLYGYAAWIARQVIPATADSTELERHADFRGLTRKAAAAATGKVTITGSVGTLVPSGTVLQRADAVQFETTAALTLTASTGVVAVRAITGGATTNADIGTVLTFPTPIVGITSAVVADDGTGRGLTGGTDTESDEALRERLRTVTRSPAGHGSEANWVAWALEVAGVTRAWARGNWNGAGTVKVAFAVDADPVSPIPSGTKVTEVATHLAQYRPVTANLTVVAPVAKLLNLTIALVPNTTEVRDAVTASLKDLLLREATLGGTILLSHIREAISIAAGETNHTLTAPTADVTATADELIVLGTITWS